jgi:flagellum-specific peptidoglycan hydrolase FlgJ
MTNKKFGLLPYLFQVLTLGTGIFPSVMLAQWAVESGYGTSNLAKNNNNFFGIKCFGDNCKGGWKNYPTKLQGYYGYVSLLVKSSRYSRARKADSPRNQIRELIKAGYAGNTPGYENYIMGIINSNDLAKYDSRIELLIFAFPTTIMLYLLLKRKF